MAGVKLEVGVSLANWICAKCWSDAGRLSVTAAMKATTLDCSALSSGLEDDTGAQESASAVIRFFPGM